MNTPLSSGDPGPDRATACERGVVEGASPSRYRRWLAAGAAVLVALLALAAVHHQRQRRAAQPAQLAQGADLPPVEVAHAARSDIHVQLDAIGTVTPLVTITVRTQINGQLQSIAFTEGQTVHKGDLLAQIDPRPYEALLRQAQGQLARDKALLAQARVDLARYRTLLQQDSIARQQVEDQAYLVQQYQAAAQSDQGQIDTQTLNLTYCRIVSPVDGRVGLRHVDPGNFVQSGDAGGIAVITQMQPISVLFPLPEDDLAPVLERLHAGATLPVVLFDRAGTTQLASGSVSTVDNEVDTTTGTWKLRATFPNTDEKLFPSQFVNARLMLRSLDGVLTIPRAAVQQGEPGAYVYLLRPDQTVTVRAVQTGHADGERVQVRAGLAVGDGVVVSGVDRLHDGARVLVAAPGDAGGP